MTQRRHTPTYTAEFRERGIRLFKENRSNYSSDNAAYRAITSKLGWYFNSKIAAQAGN